MKKFLNSVTLHIAALSALYLAGCGNDDSGSSTMNTSNEVLLSLDDNLGNILVDGDGYTLYFFANDTEGISSCYEGCTNTWPVFYAEDLQTGTGLNDNDFDEITRADGLIQTTYKGWPLYYYAPGSNGVVESAGSTGGEAFNNVWFVAKPDYSIMMANAQLVGEDGNNYTNEYSVGEGLTQYFVDSQGRTLYTFINDANGYNSFTASDLSNNGVWPVFYEDLQAIPSILSASDFGMIEVYGEMQLTYRGWPLYYFGQDEDRGDNKGVSFPSAGVWPVPNASFDEAPLYDGPTVKLTANNDFGTVMTDYRGQTLYFFSNDADGMNHCTGGCADLWPVFHAEISLADGSDLNMSDFSEMELSDGSMQTTYKGWPLYYFSPEGDGILEDAGQTSGNEFNGVWHVAKHDYALMVSNAQLIGVNSSNEESNIIIDENGDYVNGMGSTKYFVDGSNGRTIYIFSNDTKDTNTFSNGETTHDAIWPVLYKDLSTLSFPSVIDASDFGQISVEALDNASQLTFRGHPLYYFGGNGSVDGDIERGDNRGVGFPATGVWPIVNNDLSESE